MSLSCVFTIDFLGYEFNIVVKTEDAGDEQEGLSDIDQQAVGHVVDHDDLVGHQRNAAHDEQHRTGILRDFESRVFHNVAEHGFYGLDGLFLDFSPLSLASRKLMT